jgi:hypothetical protein
VASPIYHPAFARASLREKMFPPDQYYFRISTVFETGSEKLAWLNRLIAIGVGKRTATGVVYDIYAVK